MGSPRIARLNPVFTFRLAVAAYTPYYFPMAVQNGTMQCNEAVVRFRFPEILPAPPVKETTETQSASADDSARQACRMLRRAREHGYREGFCQGQENGFQSGYDDALEQGQKEGYQNGYAQGLEQGRNDSLEKINQLHTTLVTAWEAVSTWRETCARELDEQLVSVINLICRQVIQLELTVRPDGVRALLDHALDLLPQTDSATIRLNPEDRVYLETLNLVLPDNWQVIDDDAITAGGCVLSTPGGRVDAQVETRLAACIAELRKSLGLPGTNGNGG